MNKKKKKNEKKNIMDVGVQCMPICPCVGIKHLLQLWRHHQFDMNIAQANHKQTRKHTHSEIDIQITDGLLLGYASNNRNLS